MNPNNPFRGQQSGIFQSPSSSSVGTFQVQPSFRFGQSSVFGHSSAGTVQNPGFVPPGFPQPSGLAHASPRQTLGFGPPSGFIPTYGLGQATRFVPASAPTSSSITINQGFSFKPPTNLGTFQSPPNFGVVTGEASSSGSVGSEFSFKTPENAMFKPILGAVSEPEKAKNQIITTPFTFSHPGSSGHGGLVPFGLSQETSSSGNSTNFSFSKPVTSTNLPSSFASVLPSKTIEDEKRGPKPLFGSPSSSFTTFCSSSAGSLALGENFQVSKAPKLEHEDAQPESLPSLVKGMKRKEEQDHSPRRQDYDCGEESELASKSDRPPDKRPVRLNRPRGGGLFGRTLQDVLKSNKDSGRIKKETKKERVSLESGEIEQIASSGSGQPVFAISQSSTPLKEEDFKEKTKEDSAVGSPARRNRSSDSVDSLGGLSPNELTSIQLKNVPEFLNDRNVLEKYFGHIAKVRRIFTRRNKKLAIIHFFDHASAVMARKKAKGFNKDIVTFWHKKKTGKSLSCVSLYKGCTYMSFIKSFISSSPAKKSTFIKSLQFEADPFDPGSEGQSSESLGASASSLSNLIGSVAETSEEKYRLLDQRDKIMRQARVKRTDLGKAKTIVGTCPDMCPEKERYMRETRNQLSIFEVIPGSDKVDHRSAIKEYSRSSADQEEPLPHELRPSEVLSMTMDYLVTQIMDQGEGNYREWYDFVWNRTRGIRKDITQQHLCDPLTVSLIEKCTRFHIHCAHHLCEEPMSSFDAKINNENLTKCLQSLKEMYQDLGNKGFYCKSEAEFRGYNVLLNLNKGDILRTAVSNTFYKLNIYLAFFPSQIRREALKSLNFAYTVSPQRSTVFPLDSVVRMLLFKDCQEATHFINDYSLNVSDGYVELNRSAFLEPEVLPKPRKSLFIKQKLTVSVGEIVHGGPLPPVVHHIPICSFNGQNKYTGGTTTVESAGSSQKASIDMKGESNSWTLLMFYCSKNVMVQLCKPEILVKENYCFSCSASDAAIEELVTEVTMEVLRQVATDVFSAERERVQEEKRRVEEERCALERDRRARIARCSEEVCADIMHLFLEEEIFQSAKETLQELQCFCKYLQRWREAVAARKKLKRQMRAFPAAPCCVDPKNKLKALSPSAECPIAEENLAKRIVNLGHAGKLGISCTRLRWLRNKTTHQMKVQYLYQLLLCDAAWTPLDLPSLITEHIQVQQEQVFWKVLLVLPSYEEYPAKDPSRILADWLKAKFTGDTRWKAQRDVTSNVNDRVQTLALYNSISMQENQAVHVNVCIKVAHGTLSDSELDMAETQKDLLGTSGLVLLLPPKVKSEDVAEEDVYWLSALLQLKQLLQAKPFHPIIPLVVLVPSQGEEATEKEVEEGLMLQDLISAQLISDYIIVEIPDSVTDMQGTRKVRAVQWLIARCPSSLELCSQTLLQYIEDGVSHEFSKRFYHDRRERRLAGLSSQEPGAIIDLYNSVLQFLAGVASSEQVCDLSWPVTEFVEPGGNKLLPHLQWNTADHLAWLKKAVLSFQIPYMDLPPLGAPWRPVCSMIFQYVSQIASCLQTQPIIQSQVENLLSRTYCKWSGRLFASSEEDGPSVDDIPWDDILALCIDHKLRDWKPPKVPVAPEAVSKDGQIHVYFFKEHLKNFTVPFSWEQATLQTLKEIQEGCGRSRTKSPRSFSKLSPVSLPTTEHDISLSTLSGQELRLPTTADLTRTSSAKELLPEHLSSQLQLEKIESKRFEEQLHQWLAEDTGQLTDSLSLPFYLPQTLVATPQIIHPFIKTSTPCIPQVKNEHLKSEGIGTSLSDKLKHLQRLIRANKEEQIACELHFSAVLDMTDI
uniref:Minichromosome maintenance complex component 3 associated protein n=1 Tax=Crocodylus porosus TaxID=8502 RepID=A0A7M4EGM6_CROPO